MAEEVNSVAAWTSNLIFQVGAYGLPKLSFGFCIVLTDFCKEKGGSFFSGLYEWHPLFSVVRVKMGELLTPSFTGRLFGKLSIAKCAAFGLMYLIKCCSMQ